MISVSWTCDDGREGTVDLTEKTRWSIGRGGSGGDQPTVVVDHPMVSRIAMVVRETSAGPVVFRGQRENGARVTIAAGRFGAVARRGHGGAPGARHESGRAGGARCADRRARGRGHAEVDRG